MMTNLNKIYNIYQKDYVGLGKKTLKSKRMDDFTNEWLDLLLPYYEIDYRYEQGLFILTNTYKQKFSYYPGSDRIQVQATNKWENNGLKYLIDRIGK